MATTPKQISQHRHGKLYGKWWQTVNSENGILTITICGKRGSGKSWIMLYLAWLLDRDIEGNSHFSIDKVSFKASEFLSWLTAEKADWRRGSVICLDDAGLHMYNRDSLTNFIKMINKTLQNIRYKHPIVILTLPSFQMLDKHARDMTDIYIEATGKRDDVKRDNFCKIQELTVNPYYGSLARYNITKRSMKIHSKLGVSLQGREPVHYRISAPPKEIIKVYEKKKAHYLDIYNRQNINALKKTEETTTKGKPVKMNFKEQLDYCRKNIDKLKDLRGKVDTGKIMLQTDEDGNQLFNSLASRLIAKQLNEGFK